MVEVLQDNVDFDIDVNASVFETNIRGEGCFLGPLGEEVGVVTEWTAPEWQWRPSGASFQGTGSKLVTDRQHCCIPRANSIYLVFEQKGRALPSWRLL